MTRGATRWGAIWALAAGMLAALALVGAGVIPGGSAAHPAEAEPLTAESGAPTPDEALRAAITATGVVYAGDCAETRSPRDLDKVCTRLIEEQSGRQAYLAGRTFSEFSTWYFVEQSPAGWQVRATAPLDFFATSLEIPWP